MDSNASQYPTHEDSNDLRQKGGAAGSPREKGPVSRAAITSLIFGILGIVPIITGLVAVLVGWLALRALRGSEARGRRLALTGIVLGLINILAWTGTGSYWWIQTSPEKMVAGRFIEDLANGDVRSAKAATFGSSAGVSDGELNHFASQFKRWGGMPSMFIVPTIPHWKDGKLQGTCEITANFPITQRKVLSMVMVQQDGQWKITSVWMNN